MPSPQEEPDIEQGVLTTEVFTEWNFDENRLACASNYLAGESIKSIDEEPASDFCGLDSPPNRWPREDASPQSIQDIYKWPSFSQPIAFHWPNNARCRFLTAVRYMHLTVDSRAELIQSCT